MLKTTLTTLFALGLVVAMTNGLSAGGKGGKAVAKALEFKMPGIDGKEVDLSQYKGKVVLFVNVASRCGYTPQYKTLQALYQKHQADGLVIIGVPSNEFGKQEPGTNEEIAKFCSSKYDVTFPLLAKTTVNGKDACPLYQFLTSAEATPKAGKIAWNFEKFLIGRDGVVIARYASAVDPNSDAFQKAIRDALAKKE